MRAVLLSAVLIAGAAGCGKIPKPQQAQPATTKPAEPKIYTREEFSALLMGKTQDQVIELVGRPNHTSATGERSVWNYYDRTRDTISGKTDHISHVWFRNGIVEQINY